MKKIFLMILLPLAAMFSSAQGTYCNMNGNLMIFSNYDGGPLNINVDVNIPNLKIGVVSYEATQVTLSGTYVNNVTAVVYAGYSGTNNHCNSGTTTSISGAPTSATTAIVTNPASPITNPNGYYIIICGYSCSITSSQGGCNTIDQIEAYMLNYFSSSTLYAHRVQYGCWSGSQTISSGGNCCASITNLTLSTRVSDESCLNQCDGRIYAGAAGGTPPYTYTLNGTSNFNNLCTGSYVARVSDNTSAFRTDTVDVYSGGPDAPTGDTLQTFCGASVIGDLIASGSITTWYESDTSSTPLLPTDPLVNGKIYYASRTESGCESIDRLAVHVIVNAANVLVSQNQNTLTAAASFVQYQWINCATGLPVSGANSKSFSPSVNGLYAVVITENGCSDTSVCLSVSHVGIEDEAEAGFKVFPNPTDGELNIEFPEAASEGRIKILSISGETVFTMGKDAGVSLYSVELDLEKGIYFMEFLDINSKSWFKKLVVE